MSQYFPPYRSHGGDTKVDLDLSNYATKNDLKNVTHVDVSSFATKTNLASLKSEVDKLDIDKLVPVPNDLAKLSNVVKNDVVTKTQFSTLDSKVHSIDTTDVVKETDYDTDKSGLEKKVSDINGELTKGSGVASKDELDAVENKIPNGSGFLLTSVFDSTITEVENKIPNVSNLVSKSKLTTIENKITDTNGFVKKTDYNAKISDLENKIPNVSGLATLTKFASELKKVDDKVSQNRIKIDDFDASYFTGKN